MVGRPGTVCLGMDAVKPALWRPVADDKPEQATIEAV